MPNYRIKIEIYDSEAGEIVTKYDTYYGDADALHYAVKGFEVQKEKHEQTFYPNGVPNEIIPF